MRLTWQNQLAESAYDEFLALVKRRCADPAILDLSAGYDLVTRISAKGFPIRTLDTRKEILEPAKAKRPLAIDQPADTFHGILCLGTFGFVTRAAAPQLATEIRRMLAPAGLAFVSFAPVWVHDPDDTRSVRSFFDREGNLHRRDHGEFTTSVVYQNREIEALFAGFKIVALVTQTNGARRLTAMREA
ncbi:MAG TPA: class I SAM-dependent methyltransferase [Thermoanaerobaculia bacterium]|nr:class I SAM-dependent methyltransferase [Thermoanaerobaculia bacterium]